MSSTSPLRAIIDRLKEKVKARKEQEGYSTYAIDSLNEDLHAAERAEKKSKPGTVVGKGSHRKGRNRDLH